MRRRALVLLAVVGGFVTGLAGAGPAGAANLTGCQGSATSSRPDGSALGAIAAPDAATGTRSNPFVVHADGTVKYEGTSTPITLLLVSYSVGPGRGGARAQASAGATS